MCLVSVCLEFQQIHLRDVAFLYQLFCMCIGLHISFVTVLNEGRSQVQFLIKSFSQVTSLAEMQLYAS